MNKKAQRVLTLLKPKVKALGFNKTEIKGLAVKMAEKLKLDDEASEEEIDEEINNLIEDSLPMLQFAQATASRQVSEIKKQYETDDDDDDDDDEEDTSGSRKRKSGSKKSPKKKEVDEDEDDVPAYAKALMESLETLTKENKSLKEEVLAIKNGKTSDNRRSVLDAMLKDTGIFGKTIIKQFEKMNFENDDDFENFRKGVEDDLAALNQERANEGLGKLGTPPSSKTEKEDEVEVLSDEDIKAMAAM